MTHADDADLAAIAAGSAIRPDIARHVAECAECSAAVDEWRAVLRRPEADDLPSTRVWSGIRDELGLEVADDPLRPVERALPVPAAAPAARRRGRGWMLAAAAVVIAALGVLAGIGISALVRAPNDTTVAQAALAPFPGWDQTGEAQLQEGRSGERYLVVSLPGGVADDEVREVWLMRSDLSGLVSLGILVGEQGRFALPADLDLADYDVVDVSAEPIDGNPAHSGNSIVRGTLRPA